MNSNPWDELTVSEKVDRLNEQLESVVVQLNNVTAKLNNRIRTIEDDVDKLRKG